MLNLSVCGKNPFGKQRRPSSRKITLLIHNHYNSLISLGKNTEAAFIEFPLNSLSNGDSLILVKDV